MARHMPRHTLWWLAGGRARALPCADLKVRLSRSQRLRLSEALTDSAMCRRPGSMLCMTMQSDSVHKLAQLKTLLVGYR